MCIDKHMHTLMHNFWESCITCEHYQQLLFLLLNFILPQATGQQILLDC